MKRDDFMRQMDNPVPNAVLKKHPYGQLRQLWGENPKLYSAAFDKADDLHTYLGGHTGIDIGGNQGWDVVPAHDGIVTKIIGNRTDTGGLEVWITSDPLDGESVGNSRISTSYSHLDSFTVKLGQRVYKGQKGLMKLGNTGFVISGGTPYWGNAPAGKGVHLHFGLREEIYQGGWRQRYYNVMNGSSDPLPYITESGSQPHGDLSGLTVVLNNMLRYLNRSA